MNLLNSSGFLGTPASFGADLSLVMTTLAAVLVTIGWRLAVRRRFNTHHWLQTTATVLIALVAVLWMVGSFARYVVPGLPGNLSDPPFALTTVHAVTGTIALALGILIFLRFRSATPKALRRANAKRMMRTALILYLLTWLLGVVIYVTLYVGV